MRQAPRSDLPHFREALLPLLMEALREREASSTPSADGQLSRRPKRRTVALVVAATLPLGAWMLASVGADDKIVVDAADALGDPAGVERELRERGIRADIRIVPISDPYLVGKWHHVYFAPGSPVDASTYWLLRSYVGMLHMGIESVAERCPQGIECERTAQLELPADLRGRVTLVVGRSPRPGERYWARHMDNDNELAPSGAFYCYALEERPPPEAGALLERLGYEVNWLYEQDFFHSTTGGKVSEPPSGSRLWYARFQRHDAVTLYIASPRDALAWAEEYGTPNLRHPRATAPWAKC